MHGPGTKNEMLALAYSSRRESNRPSSPKGTLSCSTQLMLFPLSYGNCLIMPACEQQAL